MLSECCRSASQECQNFRGVAEEASTRELSASLTRQLGMGHHEATWLAFTVAGGGCQHSDSNRRSRSCCRPRPLPPPLHPHQAAEKNQRFLATYTACLLLCDPRFISSSGADSHFLFCFKCKKKSDCIVPLQTITFLPCKSGHQGVRNRSTSGQQYIRIIRLISFREFAFFAIDDMSFHNAGECVRAW